MSDRVGTPLRREVVAPRTPPSVRLMLVVPPMLLALATPVALLLAATAARDAPLRDDAQLIDDGGRQPALRVGPHPVEVPLRAALQERTSALAGCMRDGSDRARATAATVTLEVSFEPAGRVNVLSHTWLHDNITPMCLTLAIRDVELPVAGEHVVAEIEVTYVEGKTRVVSRVLDSRPATDPASGRNGLDRPSVTYQPVVTRQPSVVRPQDAQPAKRCPAKRHIAKQYDADELMLTGVVSRGSTRWALFSDPSGRGHIVHLGDCLGKEKARVMEIGATDVEAEVSPEPQRNREPRPSQMIVYQRLPV